MKILKISKFYHPHIGGVEKHVSEISEILTKKRFDITVVTEKYNNVLKNEERINGVKVLRLSYPKIKFLGLLYIWGWFFQNKSLFKDADIIHIHDVFIWYLPFRLIFPLKPVYITFHGWEGAYPIPLNNILQKKIAAKLTKGNICIGEYISEYFKIKSNIVVYGAAKNFLEKKIKKDKKIVYIGRLEKDTGLPLLLQALSKLKRINIDFCGDGPLAEECSKYGEVHGFVNVEPFLRKAEFCFAGGYLSIFEAFAQKCLVITAYENSLKKRYLKKTPFSEWIIIENSGKELAKRLRNYKKNHKEIQFTVSQAYGWVKNKTWDRIAEQYLVLWGTK